MEEVDHAYSGSRAAHHEDFPVLWVFEDEAQSGDLFGVVGLEIGFLRKEFAEQFAERGNVFVGRCVDHILKRSISTP